MIGSKVWLIAAVAVAGVASSVASAQGNLKIGVVSVARLVEQSPQFATAQKKHEEEIGPRQRELAAKQREPFRGRFEGILAGLEGAHAGGTPKERLLGWVTGGPHPLLGDP